ncbi:BspA family leucine-rich repeat surface protein [Turicibacter sp. TS3]|uniref:BspA family leucine-rich repeat surface protein n=1 Tax=Turicibacter sp. TS3 TaxID=2304578 RepID=UPI00137AE6DC|nr:BspA family leucine-rich repeat surface protein [Turicibacter sp. TS3]
MLETTDLRSSLISRTPLNIIDLSGLDTSTVQDRSYMFNGCSKLQEFNLASFNTTRMSKMDDMFTGE